MRAGGDSRVAVLTPPGRGAIAVVVGEGPRALAATEAHFRAANGRSIEAQPIGRISFGHWASDDGDGASHVEEVTVTRTGAEEVEIHCHGGVAASRRIVRALTTAGCESVDWKTWIRLRGAGGIESDAEVALASASTVRTAAILLDQRHGALRRDLEEIQQHLEGRRLDAAGAAIDELLSRADVGLHLARPWLAAIAGQANVGKSSLSNAILGYERSIVFDAPGTTRDVLAGETAIGGWPVRLLDAAGIRTAKDAIEAAGVELAKQQVASADVVLWVLDGSRLEAAELDDPFAAAEREIAAAVPAGPGSRKLLAVVNKADLLAKQPTAATREGRETAVVSALTGAGLPELLKAIERRLAPRPPERGAGVLFSEAQVRGLEAARDAMAAGRIEKAMAAVQAMLEK